MLSKIDSQVQKLPIDQMSRKQNADGASVVDQAEHGCSTCCKVIAVAIALIASIALFMFLSPVPALIITACILAGTGSLWIVPVSPVVTNGWAVRSTPVVPIRTASFIPSRTSSYSPIGGNVSFGGGHMRSANLGGFGMRTATLGSGSRGGNVRFGGG